MTIPYGGHSFSDGDWIEAIDIQRYSLFHDVPPRVSIDPLGLLSESVGWDSLVSNASQIYGYARWSAGSVNDYLAQNVTLGKGTWTLEMMYTSVNYGGQVTFKFYDGTTETPVGDSPYNGSASIIDTYDSIEDFNLRSQITGIVIPRNGIYRLKAIVEGKNASSDGYQVGMQRLTLWRTD